MEQKQALSLEETKNKIEQIFDDKEAEKLSFRIIMQELQKDEDVIIDKSIFKQALREVAF